MAKLMKCGHVAAATDQSGKPVCPMCFGIVEGADTVDREVSGKEGLEGRRADCVYKKAKPGNTCGGKVDSSWELPFFEYRPGQETDRYYCGCWGWD